VSFAVNLIIGVTAELLTAQFGLDKLATTGPAAWDSVADIVVVSFQRLEGDDVVRRELAILMLLIAAGIGLCGCAGKHIEETESQAVPKVSVERHVEVKEVIPDTQAVAKGIQPGDRLVSYDGKPIAAVPDLREAITAATGKTEVTLVVRRDEETVDIALAPGRIGVMLETRTKVHRLADAKVIEGIEPLSWEGGEASSWIGCARRVLAYDGEQHTYAYLMGISGSAFRLHFWRGWCPSSPDAGCGFNCAKVMLRALGRTSEVYEGKTEFQKSPDALGEQQMREKIIQGIDRGRPVIAIDVVQVPEWGIITGYQNNKRDFFCRSYFDGEMEDYNIAEKVPWVIQTIGEKGNALSDEEAVRQSIAIAHHVGVTEKFDNYYSGLRALDYWIAELENEASFATISTEAVGERCGANAWIYERFQCDRAVGVEFLNTYAGVFGKMSNAVLELAGIHEKQAKLLEAGAENIVSPYMGDTKEWTQELRNKQAATLKEVLKLEREALELIETIMEVCEIEPYKAPDTLQEALAP